MWKLIIIISAINGFKSNTEGGVAVQNIEFQTQGSCLEAKSVIDEEMKKHHVLFVRTFCVKE